MERKRYDRCPNCMKILESGADTCPHCQFDIAGYEERPNCLKPFTILENKYMIGRVIGMGGFGITYIGWDLNLQTYIAIKEYFPDSLASRDTTTEVTTVSPNESKVDLYQKGLKRYVEEAQSISRFYQLQGVVSVKDFFYANETAYIVMEYINGINLKTYIKKCGGRINESTVLALMKPVFESLFQIHNAGLIHRDISPDNIMVDSSGKIKLIDFGSARGSAQETDKTYTVILKHGYAPPEQYYAKGNQGPWTDIYSLCATMYKMLTGEVPPNSVERMETDEYKDPSALGLNISDRTQAVLRKGLAIKVADRYQNIGQLLNDLYGSAPINQMNGMPTPVATTFSATGSPSVSQQSMHISMQPTGAQTGYVAQPQKKNKFLPAIIAGVAVAVVGIVALVIGISGKSTGKKKTTTEELKPETTTEATTEGNTTTEEVPVTTETVAPSGYQYVWPTELSNNWKDYTLQIDDTIYQFPMPYSEWVSKGWEPDYLAPKIAAGDYQMIDMKLGKFSLGVLVQNFGLSEAPIEECFVTGLSINTEYYKVPADAVIKIAGGVQFGVSTVEEVKNAIGAPDYYDDESSDGTTSMDYYGDEWEDGLDLQFGVDGKLCSISMANTQMPADYTVDPSQISIAPPEFNANYVVPAQPSSSRADLIFTIDGYNYKLPVPVSEFLVNGWTLDSSTDEVILANSTCDTYLEKNGNKISVTLNNVTVNGILPQNAIITEITIEKKYCSLDCTFPGPYDFSSDSATINSIYGDLGEEDFYLDDWTSSMVYCIYFYDDQENYIYHYIFTDPDTSEITEVKYTMYIDDEPY